MEDKVTIIKTYKRRQNGKANILLLAVLIIIISVSIMLRVPKVNDENYYNSDATYHTLLTMTAYDETPFSVHKFLPIVSLGGENNKYIPWGATIPDNKGNYYYTSFSPAGYIVPYFFVKLFHLPINEMSLYIFNSLLSIICCILTIVLFKKIFEERLSLFCIVIFTGLIYLFQLEIMHSQGITYWHQSLFQMLFLLQVILFLYRHNKKAVIGFYILCLINPYVEWTGYISNIGFVIAIILEKKSILKNLKINIVVSELLGCVKIIALTLLSFGIFSIHYLSVVSSKQYLNALIARFTARSLVKSGPMELIIGYWNSYGLFITFLGILLIIILSMNDTRKEFFHAVKRNKIIWILLTFPLIENIIMMQHASKYSYDRLKGVFVLILMFFTLVTALNYKIKYKVKLNIFILAVIILIGFSNTFEYINCRTQYRWKVNYSENVILANYLTQRFDGSNSIFGQLQPVRGYTNLLFNRGIYEGAGDKECIAFALKNNKRFAVLLDLEVVPWTKYKYQGYKIYDLQEKTLEEGHFVDGELKTNLTQYIE